MKATATHNEKIARTAAPHGKPRKFRPLQLAPLVDAVPSGNDWFHEIKYDGYRALVAAAGRAGAVCTRGGPHGRESCRERVRWYVSIPVVAGAVKTTTHRTHNTH